MIFQFVFMSITVKPLANASSRPFQPFSVTFDTKVTIDCLVLRIPRWQRIGWLREIGCEDCRAEEGGGEQLLFVDEFHQCVFQPSMIARSQMRTFTIRLMSSSNEMRVSSSGTTGSSVTTIN